LRGLCAVRDLECKSHGAGHPAPSFDRVDLLGLRLIEELERGPAR
jgi:hypothetical protein